MTYQHFTTTGRTVTPDTAIGDLAGETIIGELDGTPVMIHVSRGGDWATLMAESALEGDTRRATVTTQASAPYGHVDAHDSPVQRLCVGLRRMSCAGGLSGSLMIPTLWATNDLHLPRR